jgi:thiosulfate/3-mercaptopyruvate sulfurtransferase
MNLNIDEANDGDRLGSRRSEMRRAWVALLVGLTILQAGEPAVQAQQSQLLVDAAWLNARLGDRQLRIMDMVSEPGEYQKGHIPGAVYLHFNDTRIAVPSGGFRVPTVEEGARLLGALGIGPDTQVVIYDDAGGLHASRLFFTLDLFGHPRMAILNGGIQAWQRAGFRVTRETPLVTATTYRPSVKSERVTSADGVLARLKDPNIALVDARSPAEYAGKDVRAKRGGHIPGAVNIEWSQHLRPDGTFKPIDELRTMYLAKAVTPDKTVIAYCQTHHRSAHTYFVLRLLGYPKVVGYDRSWSEWGNRDDLPIER